MVIQYGFDKSPHIDLMRYPMNVAVKLTSLTEPNKISIGNNVYKFLHPSLKLEFQKMHTKESDEWKYIDRENNSSHTKFIQLNNTKIQ